LGGERSFGLLCEAADVAAVFERTMRVGVMSALENETEVDGGAIVAGDGEADGVHVGIGRKTGALSASVPEVTELLDVESFGSEGFDGGEAEPAVEVAEGQHGITAGFVGGFEGMEAGAGHFATYTSTRMTSTRLEALRSMVAARPSDSFLRYGLAMELRNGGDLEGAMTEFQALIAADPLYCAGYFHGGQTLEKLGRLDEAREMYRAGIDAAGKKGDAHTRDELQAALSILGD